MIKNKWKRTPGRVTSAVAVAVAMGAVLTGCSDAEVASRNTSVEADQFRVTRRIIFVNTPTGEVLFEVTGKCSIYSDTTDQQLEIICKVGDDAYRKHFLGNSATTTYFAEQIESVDVSEYFYSFVFKPETIAPTFTR